MKRKVITERIMKKGTDETIYCKKDLESFETRFFSYVNSVLNLINNLLSESGNADSS